MTSETRSTNPDQGKVIQMGNTADNVDSHSPYYTDYMEKSELVRTLIKGTRGMKDAGKTFLPSAQLETSTSYNIRLLNSVLVNAYRKTASFMAGQVFQTDVILEEGVPADFKTYADAIDPLGNDINVFAKRAFQHGLEKGVAHILVDAPVKEPGRTYTVAEEKELGIRPFMKEIKPEDVIGWIVDENGVLVQVRIKETVTTREGDFGTKEVKRIRVLEQGAWFVYEQEDGKDYTLKDKGAFSVNKIPLFTFIPGEEWTAMTGETPLQDLAELNLRHWRSLSDQINILHVGRVPFLFGIKVDLTVLPSGVATMVTSDEDGADVKYVEITGAAIAAGQTDLTELEAKMALWGLQQLIPRTGNQTATEKALTSGESNSSLGTWATEFESTLQSAFELMGEYMNQVFPPKSVSLNKEYSFGTMSAEEGTMLLKSVDTGVMSAQGCFAEFKRRNIVDEHKTWDDNQAEMEGEARADQDTLGGLTGGFFQNQNL